MAGICLRGGKMVKTRNVNKDLCRNYLAKAEEYFAAMNEEFEKRRFNSCVLCAIHCGISAADALTIFFKGIRHAGERHEDVVQLIEELGLEPQIIPNKIRQLLSLLQVKNQTEYEERLATESGASIAMKNAERFFGWVRELLG